MSTRRITVLLMLVLLLTGCCLLSKPGTAGKREIVPPYYCQRASMPLKIDGLLDDLAWEKAKVVVLGYAWRPPDINVRRMGTVTRTEGRLLYDDQYLYVGFKAYDEDIWATYTERDSTTWREDVLEVFFKTDPEKDPYFNFEINVLGTVLDAWTIKRWSAGNYKRWMDWNCPGLKVATTVRGTLNDWQDRDEYWILEIAIPFSGLPTLSRPPQKGDVWLFNLSRYDYSVYQPEGKELSSLGALDRLDFHWYENWVPLIFQ